jgi:hypothetical protein
MRRTERGMTSYLVVHPDGPVHVGEDFDELGEFIDAVVGPDGRARVRLREPYSTFATGWVSDCGLILPERYKRNALGGCLLAALGAGVQPYAGPVVISGWDDSATARGETEIVPLGRFATSAVVGVLDQVSLALAGEAKVPDAPPGWVEGIRRLATHIRDGEVPPPVLRTIK